MARKIEGRMAESKGGTITFIVDGQGGELLSHWTACTMIEHNKTHEPVYTRSEVEQLVKTLRMAFNVIDKLNAEGFGPLTSKEGLDAFSAVVDALGVFDPA